MKNTAMFTKASLRMSQEIDRQRVEGTELDPKLFKPNMWRREDLIDALRNCDVGGDLGLLPMSPCRSKDGTLRAAAAHAADLLGAKFTLELKRLSEGGV